MKRAIPALATAVLLAGPAALAFFSGGFFDEPRLWAGIAAWALVGAAAVIAPRPLPRSAPARAAVAGLAALTAWTGISLAWAPLAGPAWDDLQRLLLYLGALVATIALLRPARAQRALEPAVAGGALLVIAYGLSERLLPWLVELDQSRSAAGRLEQPLTYWNATGALAAIGFVLCARLAGDPQRGARLRAAAAAAAAPLGMGLYLSFSRGSLAALAVGLVALLLLAPRRSQLAAIVACLSAGGVAAAAGQALPFVRGLDPSGGSPDVQGAAALAVALLAAAGAAFATLRIARPRPPGAVGDGLHLPRRGYAIAALSVLLAAAVIGAAVLERREGVSEPARGATAQRLGSVESNRYDYWKVALDEFAADPLAGGGSGSFRVDWLREREFPEAAQDAHSLYIETAAELGLVGLFLLILFIAGVVQGLRRLQRARPEAAAGLGAGLAVWAAHAGIDWDWEMPAVTLVAIVLAGAALAQADEL